MKYIVILLFSLFLIAFNVRNSDLIWEESDFFAFYENPIDDTILINFWATWCKPCIAEMPELIEVTKEQGIKSYFISLDHMGKSSAVEAFINEKKWNSNFKLVNINNLSEFVKNVDPEWSSAIPYTILVVNGKRYFHYAKFNNKDEIRAFLSQ